MKNNIALELKNAGINVKIKEAFSETVKAGRIISASHKKGSKIYRGATVTLTKSIGKPIQYLSFKGKAARFSRRP